VVKIPKREQKAEYQKFRSKQINILSF
jgi:hypothetical protein